MKRVSITGLELTSPACIEALNAICSNLLFTAGEKRRIVFAGCAADAGAMAGRMVCALARRGKRVLLVEADLRANSPADGKTGGLFAYLEGKCGPEDLVCETDVANAFLIPAGGQTNDPVPLLAGARFEALMEKAAQEYDMVVVQAPRAGVMVDAAEIARTCDGAVLVLQYGVTKGREAKAAARQLALAGCPVLGCVIDQAEARA